MNEYEVKLYESKARELLTAAENDKAYEEFFDKINLHTLTACIELAENIAKGDCHWCQSGSVAQFVKGHYLPAFVEMKDEAWWHLFPDEEDYDEKEQYCKVQSAQTAIAQLKEQKANL